MNNFLVTLFCLGCLSLTIVLVTGRIIIPLSLISHLDTEISLRNGSTVTWKNPKIETYLNVYYFNVTNPIEIKAGEEPLLQETGSYVYNEEKVKKIISGNWESGTIRYAETLYYCFNEELSIGKESDLIVALSVPYMRNGTEVDGRVEINKVIKGLSKTRKIISWNTKLIKDLPCTQDNKENCPNNGPSQLKYCQKVVQEIFSVPASVDFGQWAVLELSLPNLLYADIKHYRKIGVTPNDGLHNCLFVVEPITGEVLMHKRLQTNAAVERLSQISVTILSLLVWEFYRGSLGDVKYSLT